MIKTLSLIAALSLLLGSTASVFAESGDGGRYAAAAATASRSEKRSDDDPIVEGPEAGTTAGSSATDAAGDPAGSASQTAGADAAGSPSATPAGMIRYEEIEGRIAGSAASDALDKQLEALKNSDMTVFTRDSIVYQIRLSKVGREKAAAEMTRAAQQAYTDIIRLGDSIESLQGAKARAERLLAALQIKLRYKLATQLELDEAQHAVDELEHAIEKAALSKSSLELQLGFLCGEGSGKPLTSYGMPLRPSDSLIEASGSDEEYYQAKKANFDLRSQKEDLWYAENFQNGDAEQAAKADSVRTEQQLRIIFDQSAKTLKEKQLAIKSAESAAAAERTKLDSAKLRAERGLISLYELKEQEYAAAEAERACTNALLGLTDAWEDYCWTVKGLTKE